ncbi:MAG TPA: hypothetical protein VFH16_07005 [Rubrobacter sp.]|nr:hypothetical protein [Rubrobacter sp.]
MRSVEGFVRGGNVVSSGMIRLSGLAAMLGGVLGIVLTPILTYLWASYSDAYLYYGRAYFPVYLGCIAGLAGLYALRRRNLGFQGTEKLDTEKLVFGMTFVGLAVSLVGDILEYWGGSPGEDFTMVQMQGFGIEMLGLMLVLFGSVAFGLTYRRANILPTLVVWLLIAAGPGGILFSILLHAPSGTMLVFCCAWVVLGYLLLLGRDVIGSTRP